MRFAKAMSEKWMWNGDPGSWHGVDCLERGLERLGLCELAVARRVHVGEVEDRPHPARAARDLEHVVERAQVTHAAHHFHSERNGSILALEALAELAQLLDHGVERILARALEQKAGVEDNDFRAARLRDARRVVEHAHGHVELLAALGVAHEARQRCVHGQREVVLAGELAEPPGEVVVHPEACLEVDLAGGVAALEEQLDRPLGAVLGRHAGRPEADFAHVTDATARRRCLRPTLFLRCSHG